MVVCGGWNPDVEADVGLGLQGNNVEGGSEETGSGAIETGVDDGEMMRD